MDSSLPGSSVHGVLQARVLEWAARPSSRGSSHFRGIFLTQELNLCLFISCNGRWVLYHHLGSPWDSIYMLVFFLKKAKVVWLERSQYEVVPAARSHVPYLA